MTDQQQILSAISQVQKALRVLPFCCLYPKCRRQAIDSHSQQKEGQLRAISEHGKVYCLDPDVFNAIKNQVISVHLTGIREASTFPGYCCVHDGPTFSAIEKESLAPDRQDQAALLFLRSISYEYASKLKALYCYRELLRRVGRLLPPDMAQVIYASAIATDAYRRVEGRYYFQRTYAMCDKREFDQLCVVWRVLDHTLPLSLSTSFCPWLDTFSEKKTSLGTVQPLVSMSLIPEPSRTHVVFSWRREHEEDAKWIRDAVVDTHKFEDLLNRCIAETADCCIRPSFWDSLGSESRHGFVQNMRHSLFHERDDGVKIIRLTNATYAKSGAAG